MLLPFPFSLCSQCLFSLGINLILFYVLYGFSYFQLKSYDTASKRTPITNCEHHLYDIQVFAVFIIDIRFFVQKCLAMWMVSIFTHTFASNKKAQNKKEEICLFTLSKRIWSNKTKTITVYCIDDTIGIQSTTPAEIYSITSWTVRWNEIRV